MKALPLVSPPPTPDIPKTITTTPTTVSIHASGATQLTHDLFTNNILYLDVALDLTRLGPELLPLVPLFCRWV